MTISLDPADRTILRTLQQDSRAGLESLAAQTGLSTASVQRRIKALKANGTILHEIAEIDPAKVGQSMSFIVMVEMHAERTGRLDEFSRRIREDPQVQQCYYITGDADFCLICTARDLEDYEDLTRRLFFENSNVRRIRTSVVMSRRKTGAVVHIAEP